MAVQFDVDPNERTSVELLWLRLDTVNHLTLRYSRLVS